MSSVTGVGTKIRRVWSRYKIQVLILFAGLLIWYLFALPSEIFNADYSTVLVDKNEELLSARIAGDEQWRFPPESSVPEWFEKAILCFEDKRFYYHPGIDPLALLRAFKLNIQNGKVVSGGSTISMQVIRLSRQNKNRTVIEKFIELILATRLELSYSKKEILNLYAAHAPFGGNIVGLEAASWKYFSRHSKYLSLGQCATLAVLPNAPGIIHPNKNRDLLREKRNKLLKKMMEEGLIDEMTANLAMEEDLPDRSKPLPDLAPHLIQRVMKEKRITKESKIRTTLSYNTQVQANNITRRHSSRLRQSGINNIAAIILDTKTGNVLAYVGNTPNSINEHGNSVDIITSHRSTGSVLKPFLYAQALDEGVITTNSILPDIPSYYSGYTPKNFDLTYSGAVPANEALYRSLNVPAIRLLSELGLHKTHHMLKKVGFTTFTQPSIHYGLSLILGGAECTLWDLSKSYSGMARTLLFYEENGRKYSNLDYREPSIYLDGSEKEEGTQFSKNGPLSAGALYLIAENLTEVRRPGAENYWRSFASSGKIAWKTGTSFGFRDAWSVGFTPEYTIAVWCGNADGEGRPGLIGVQAAAPFMFDLFNMIDLSNKWFEPPISDLTQLSTCQKSGFKSGEYCTQSKMTWQTIGSNQSKICPYHKKVWLDQTKNWQVHDNCESPQNMLAQSYFILPPVMEKYYKNRNPDYKSPPSYREDCQSNLKDHNKEQMMQFVYPNATNKFSIPIQLDESKSAIVFEVSHRESKTKIYWHLDGVYIGFTTEFHEMALNPNEGKHELTLVDEKGEVISLEFKVVG